MYVAKCFVRHQKETQPPPDSTTMLVPRILSRWDKGGNEGEEKKEDELIQENSEKEIGNKMTITLKNLEPEDEASTSIGLIPFYTAMDVYLKPIYSIKIRVILPRLRQAQVGQSISNWDLKEKIKKLASPIELINIKVSQSTLEEVEFISSLKNDQDLKRAVELLHDCQFRALGFTEQLKLSVEEGTSDFPTRAEWDKFFREAEDMDERVPGERPDTVYIGGLPHDWFQPKKSYNLEDTMEEIMSEYGEIRKIDIPQSDLYRKQMDQEISGLRMSWWTLGSEPFFEAYVQYTEYKGFVNAMNTLHGKQLIRKMPSGKLQEASLKVDFDRTKHLTDKKILLRSLKRSCIQYQMEVKQKKEDSKPTKEDNSEKRQKEQQKIARRILREEKRRQKIEKIKQEAFLRKKLKRKRKEVKSKRKIESKRLLEYIFDYHFKKFEAKAREKESKDIMLQLSEYVKQNGLDDEDRLRENLLRGKELRLRAKMAQKVLNEVENESSTKRKRKPKLQN
uniref:RRM domain-containing protein n=1 Tax=Acrobeloides nanus TaxID=290746 RepID=A0A914CYU2_9BILA